jgi:hypothetical protein
MGYPDQAGRWGIVIEGWTTERERDRLARLIASGTHLRRAHQLLHLPAGMRYTDEMMTVIGELAPTYRARMQARTGLPRDVEPNGPASFGGLTIFVAVLVFVLGCVAALAVQLLQIADGNLWLVCVGGATSLGVGVGLFALCLGGLLKRRYGRSALFFLGGVLAMAGGIGTFTIAVSYV